MRYDTQKLKAARLRLGWGQTQVAYLAKLSVAAVNRAERGKSQRPDTITKIAHVLGVSMEELVIPEEPELVTK